MTDQLHAEIMELIPAYVLGAVPPEEIPTIRAHILSCDECIAEADRFAETASALALSVESAPLSPDFAERVMAAATGRSEEAVAPSPARARHFSSRWSLVPTAAFLVLLLTVIAVSVTLYQTNQTLNQERTALAAIIQGDQGIDLKGPGGAVATIVPTSSGSLFVASGLKQAPDERTYQLWLIKGEEPVSAGTFQVSDGLVMFETAKSIDGYSAAAVTVEPEGGSPTPTGVQVVTSVS